MYMISYNNIPRPVHAPPTTSLRTPRPILPKIWGSRPPNPQDWCLWMAQQNRVVSRSRRWKTEGETTTCWIKAKWKGS